MARRDAAELTAESAEFLPFGAEVGLRDVAEGAVTSLVGYIEGWVVDHDMRR